MDEPAWSASDVARRRRSPWKTELIDVDPNSTTTNSKPCGPRALSISIPASFFPWRSRSLGHLQYTGRDVAARTPRVRQRRWPGRRGLPGQGGVLGRRITEKVRFSPRFASQLRPSLPRPAVCFLCDDNGAFGGAICGEHGRGVLVESMEIKRNEILAPKRRQFRPCWSSAGSIMVPI